MVRPRFTPHRTFGVRSGILAPVFGWIEKHCFATQRLNFQRHLDSESAAPSATSLMRGHVDRFLWEIFEMVISLREAPSSSPRERRKEVGGRERGGLSEAALEVTEM